MISNILELTVSEFSRSIKRVLEDNFGYLRIKGEVTGFKKAASGHLYFTLKEESAILTAVCFRNMAQLIDFELVDGLEVVVSGKITTYEGRSNYQIIVEKVEMAGIGAIMEMIEKRRKKLLAEGLFDEKHKKPIPFFPRSIGVITSKTGSVIEDIKHRIENRCPTHILLYPVLVQGQKACLEIVNALKFFNNLENKNKPDVVIIARGGGSFEDLLPFNDEILVREVFSSKIPVISAIGHETDTSLIDYVSDLRAPTPTAAAEFATPVLFDLKSQLEYLSQKIRALPLNYLEEKWRFLRDLQKYTASPRQVIEQFEERLENANKGLKNLIKSFFEKNLQKINSLQISNQVIFGQINLVNQKINHLFDSLKTKLKGNLEIKQINLNNLEKLLKSHHYQEILNRGFAMIKDKNGSLITSTNEINLKDKFIVEISDGKIEGEVINKYES